MTMATLGADILASEVSDTGGSEVAGVSGAGMEGDGGLGSDASAFVSCDGVDFGSAKLFFCRFPGKHIAKMYIKALRDRA